MSVTTLAGTTWQFNDVLTPIQLQWETQTVFAINGSINNNTFTAIMLQTSGNCYWADPLTQFYSSSSGWGSSSAAQISFTDGTSITDADLITWIEANATQIIKEIIVTYNNTEIATLSDTGTINLDTESTYCIDDIIINYTRPEVPEDGDNLAYGSPLSSLAGTTWVFNQSLNISADTSYSVNFTTSNVVVGQDSFYSMTIQYNSTYEAFALRFYAEQQNVLVYWTDQGWKYDIGSVTFIDGTDIANSDLIDWMYANATLQTS